jgi:hypothetical protein
MTEAEWLAATDPTPMEMLVLKDASPRKLRLYIFQCLNRNRHLLREARSLRALDVFEQSADGTVSEIDLNTAQAHAGQAFKAIIKSETEDKPSYERKHVTAAWLVYIVFELEGRRPEVISMGLNQSEEGCIFRCNRLREMFTPFRPITLNPTWLTSTVLALANGIYREKAFDRMPILADALQDAGCDNEDILNHCRLPGEHCQGCWVVDLLLSKV